MAQDYRVEFPHFDASTMPVIPSHWKDVSWHNDACPSWKAGDLVVFIDFPNPEDRDWDRGIRFSVHHAETCEVILEGNDWDEILSLVQ